LKIRKYNYEIGNSILTQDPNLHIAQHPLAKRDLSILRNRQTDAVMFRSAMRIMATLLACIALKDLPLRKTQIETPIDTSIGYEIDCNLVIVPIFRPGVGMSSGAFTPLP